MYMNPYEIDYFKRMIERETKPLRERIEKLEAERKQAPAPHGMLEQIEEKAREWAGYYEPHSDSRNTFVLFAEWVATLPRPERPAPMSSQQRHTAQGK